MHGRFVQRPAEHPAGRPQAEDHKSIRGTIGGNALLLRSERIQESDVSRFHDGLKRRAVCQRIHAIRVAVHRGGFVHLNGLGQFGQVCRTSGDMGAVHQSREHGDGDPGQRGQDRHDDHQFQ